jgi:hypothetical protein
MKAAVSTKPSIGPKLNCIPNFALGAHACALLQCTWSLLALNATYRDAAIWSRTGDNGHRADIAKAT